MLLYHLNKYSDFISAHGSVIHIFSQILAVTGGDQPDEGQQLLRKAAGGQAGYEELAPELQPVQTALTY